MNSRSVQNPLPVTDSPTTETVIRCSGGSVIVVQRYGPDDYDAWFTDRDHMDDDTFGSSVRGSFVDIVREIKEVIL